MGSFLQRILREAEMAQAEIEIAAQRVSRADQDIVRARMIRLAAKADARIHREAERLLRKVAKLLDA